VRAFAPQNLFSKGNRIIHEAEHVRAANHYDIMGNGAKAEEHLRAAERELNLAIDAFEDPVPTSLFSKKGNFRFAGDPPRTPELHHKVIHLIRQKPAAESPSVTAMTLMSSS
jgi:hypothetical protein